MNRMESRVPLCILRAQPSNSRSSSAAQIEDQQSKLAPRRCCFQGYAAYQFPLCTSPFEYLFCHALHGDLRVLLIVFHQQEVLELRLPRFRFALRAVNRLLCNRLGQMPIAPFFSGAGSAFSLPLMICTGCGGYGEIRSSTCVKHVMPSRSGQL